jgi:hypothetical protein
VVWRRQRGARAARQRSTAPSGRARGLTQLRACFELIFQLRDALFEVFHIESAHALL